MKEKILWVILTPLIVIVVAFVLIVLAAVLLVSLLAVPFMAVRYMRHKRAIGPMPQRLVMIVSSQSRWQHFITWNKAALQDVWVVDVADVQQVNTAKHLMDLVRLDKRQQTPVLRGDQAMLMCFKDKLWLRSLGVMILEDKTAYHAVFGKREAKLLQTMRKYSRRIRTS